jgi:hypothetical protein
MTCLQDVQRAVHTFDCWLRGEGGGTCERPALARVWRALSLYSLALCVAQPFTYRAGLNHLLLLTSQEVHLGARCHISLFTHLAAKKSRHATFAF